MKVTTSASNNTATYNTNVNDIFESSIFYDNEIAENKMVVVWNFVAELQAEMWPNSIPQRKDVIPHRGCSRNYSHKNFKILHCKKPLPKIYLTLKKLFLSRYWQQ